MADYFIDSATGTDSGTGANTAGTAYYTLKYAIENANGAPTNNDRFLINYTHVEDFTATVYGTAGSETIDLLPGGTYATSAGPIVIMSTDFGVGSGTTFRPMTGKFENTAGSLFFLATAADGSGNPSLSVRFIGLKFRTSSSFVGLNDPIIADFAFCQFAFASGTDNTDRFRLDANAVVSLSDCHIDYETGSNQTFIENGTTDIFSDITINRCTFANLGGTPTSSLFDLNGYTNPTGNRRIKVFDCDLSAFTSLFTFNEDQGKFDVRFTRCKVNDTWANMETNNGFGDATYFQDSRVEIEFVQCSNTDVTATPTGLSYLKSTSGNVESSTTAYYTTSPASDGENNYSWQYSPNVDCGDGHPLSPIVRLGMAHPGGDLVLRVRMASDFVALTDGEVFAEIHAPGHTAITGSATVGNYISTRAIPGSSTSQLSTRTVAPGTTTFTSASHGFVTHQPLWFKSTGTLNTGIVEGKIYYCRDVNTDDFKVSETPGGTAITFTDDDTGTVTAYPLLVAGSAAWTGTGSVTGYSFEVPVYATEPGTIEVAVSLAKANSGANEKLWVHPELELF